MPEPIDAQHCTAAASAASVHRPLLILPRGALVAACRYCGADITRAHRRSTWWRAIQLPPPPETFQRADDPGEGGEC